MDTPGRVFSRLQRRRNSWFSDTSIIPDEAIRVISHCEPGDQSDLGTIFNPQGKYNLVSFGVNIMVQTTSLSILEAASEGRVTPLKLWRWVMSVGQHRGWAMEHLIEYNGPDLNQYPSPFPGFQNKDLINLYQRNLGDAEILDELIFKGRFWVWMRPDRYTDSKLFASIADGYKISDHLRPSRRIYCD